MLFGLPSFGGFREGSPFLCGFDTAAFLQLFYHTLIVILIGMTLHIDACSAVYEFGIHQFYVHHLVAFDPSKAYHDRRTDHVENQFLRSSALHTGASGDEFRSRYDLDHMV